MSHGLPEFWTKGTRACGSRPMVGSGYSRENGGAACSVGGSCLDHLAGKSLVELQRQLQNHQNGATQCADFKSRAGANDRTQSNKHGSGTHLRYVAPFVSVGGRNPYPYTPTTNRRKCQCDIVERPAYPRLQCDEKFRLQRCVRYLFTSAASCNVGELGGGATVGQNEVCGGECRPVCGYVQGGKRIDNDGTYGV
jgi:hypothetical protein